MASADAVSAPARGLMVPMAFWIFARLYPFVAVIVTSVTAPEPKWIRPTLSFAGSNFPTKLVAALLKSPGIVEGLVREPELSKTRTMSNVRTVHVALTLIGKFCQPDGNTGEKLVGRVAEAVTTIVHDPSPFCVAVGFTLVTVDPSNPLG